MNENDEGGDILVLIVFVILILLGAPMVAEYLLGG